jgi:hypothetical protein
MLWTCVESGSYAVRVAQTSGAGAFQLQVGDFGTLEFTSAAAGLTVLGTAPEWVAQVRADAVSAQKLGRPQPFIAVFPQARMGQLASFGPA